MPIQKPHGGEIKGVNLLLPTLQRCPLATCRTQRLTRASMIVRAVDLTNGMESILFACFDFKTPIVLLSIPTAEYIEYRSTHTGLAQLRLVDICGLLLRVTHYIHAILAAS